MLVFRVENPAAHMAEMDALCSALGQIEKRIAKAHQAKKTFPCSSCSQDVSLDSLHQTGYLDVLLCSDCLARDWDRCGTSFKYYPKSEIQTLYDGLSSSKMAHPRKVYKRLTQGVFSCARCNENFYNAGIVIRDTRKRVCLHCASQIAIPCGSCGHYYSSEEEADSCCGSQFIDTYKRVDVSNVDRGTDFTRFLDRPVGIELETGEGGRLKKVYRWMEKNLPGWGCMGDGSLPYGGFEFVSNPTTGDHIESNYRNFAKALLKMGVEVDCQQAGYHVHVEATDIFNLVGKLHTEDEDRAIKCEKIIKTWGNLVTNISRELVSPVRKNSHYCSGAFGARSSKGRRTEKLKTMPTNGYPTIAIREETIEFRIFPSTANLDWHVARMEFAQKSLEYLYDLLQPRIKVSRIKNFSSELKSLKGMARINCICTEFNLSMDSRMALRGLHKYWNPEQYGMDALEPRYKAEPVSDDAIVSEVPEVVPEPAPPVRAPRPRRIRVPFTNMQVNLNSLLHGDFSMDSLNSIAQIEDREMLNLMDQAAASLSTTLSAERNAMDELDHMLDNL